jgi:hypothetical protein
MNDILLQINKCRIDTLIIRTHEELSITKEVTVLFEECFKCITRNIIWLGSNMETSLYLSEDMLNRCRVWYFDDYNNRIQNCLKDEYILDIPVITICGCSEDTELKVLVELCSLFREQGYYTIGVSGLYESILYGIEYKPSGVHANKFLPCIYKKYGCDLIVAGLSGDIPPVCSDTGVDDSFDDIRIVFSENRKVYVMDVKEPENGSVLTMDEYALCIDDIMQLFGEILQFFDGSNRRDYEV